MSTRGLQSPEIKLRKVVYLADNGGGKGWFISWVMESDAVRARKCVKQLVSGYRELWGLNMTFLPP